MAAGDKKVKDIRKRMQGWVRELQGWVRECKDEYENARMSKWMQGWVRECKGE